MRKVVLAVMLVLLIASGAWAYKSRGDMGSSLRYKHLEVRDDGTVAVEIVNEKDELREIRLRLLFTSRGGTVVATTYTFLVHLFPHGSMEIETYIREGTAERAQDASKLKWLSYK